MIILHSQIGFFLIHVMFLFLTGLVSKIGYNIEEAASRQRVFYYQVRLLYQAGKSTFSLLID